MGFLKSNFLCHCIFLLFAVVSSAEAELNSVPEVNPTEQTRYTLLDSSVFTEFPIEIHGFVSQGYIQSTGNNFIPKSQHGSTDFADAGLTFNKMLTSNLRIGAQLFARDFGRLGDYSAKFDWFVLDYRWRDWLGLRVGRVKIPHGLFNETNDIDAARVPIFLPQSLYPIEHRDYLLAQTGVDLYGHLDFSSAGAIEYRIYRGTLNITSTSTTPGLPYEVGPYDIPYVYGSRLIWETPLAGLRLGATFQSLLIESDLYVPSIPVTIATDLQVNMRTGSLEYTNRRFQFVAEYSTWRGKVDSSQPTIIAPVYVLNERYYGMVSYSLTEWLQPGFYHSVTNENKYMKDRPQDFTQDTAVFCRVDLTENWIFKAEWHYIFGTSALQPGINANKTRNDMDAHWQLFMAKTTIFF